MLYLTRKIGESVIINDDIEVTVIDIRGKSIKLGFTFPTDATVLRREIFERIQAENRAAAEGGEALAQAIKNRRPDGQAQLQGRGQDQGQSRGQDQPKGESEPSG